MVFPICYDTKIARAMRLLDFCNRAIEYLFYALFFLVPIVFLGSTSELFELNKIWLTYAISILIALFWGIKIITTKTFQIRRTPLDIPILLFLGANILSTIFSWDPYVSFWGYYSRFNGGLLSIITYVFLYYAFVSNFEANLKTVVKNLLGVSLLSGLFVSLWGLPSHFGYDPTCLLFRGSFDVSCWTADFQPKVRIFSTIGQPAWLSAYLAILVPISLSYAISKRNALIELLEKINIKRAEIFSFILFSALSALFFVDILYTGSRSGILAMLLSLLFLLLGLFILQRESLKEFVSNNKKLFAIFLVFAVIGFVLKVPFPYLEKISLENLKQISSRQTQIVKPEEKQAEEPHAVALGGTDSGKIRQIVWKGAIDMWRANPILGTGVETFAFSYYKYRPEEHNRTSEWNFLYNKAHNEYLNYLATTGALGFLSYLSIIAVFVLLTKK
ncbi:MAG: O-antigen ligase family protein, partial [Patescibacteria group bacterium]